MKTPKEYTDSIKKGVITMEILRDCLFSVNKRAKNCRDKEREYRGLWKYEYDYQSKKEKYYSQKDQMLTLIEPTSIHSEIIDKRKRIYDYEEEYWSAFSRGNYVHSNSYYDRNEDREIEFIDVIVKEKKYYLFYDMGEKSFHSPICEDIISKYPHLEIIDIGSLDTFGHQIGDLLSTQFVGKVLQLIESGKYVFINHGFS